VTVYEETNGVIYVRESGRKPESLRTRSREWAKAEAKRRQAESQLGLKQVGQPTPTVARILRQYMEHHSRERGRAGQEQDRQCKTLWTVVLGADYDLSKYWRGDHERFIKRRMSGTIDARGNRVPPDKQKPVGPRTAAKDLEWLRTVCLWAMGWRDESGSPLLLTNPLHGLDIPKEKNPRRPTATSTRYEKTRAVSDRITMQLRRYKQRVTVRSYLSEILDIVYGTGRRISAVLQLQYADIRLSDEPAECGIRWRADTDKMGKEWYAPANSTVRGALRRIVRERPGVGAAYLFPSPANPRRPVSKRLVSQWLEKAEQLGKLSRLDGGLWHPYRRLWGTARKHHPVQDVMKAGGWSNPRCLQEIYQQADADTLLRVVSEAAEVREVVGQ
jgi:integrase